MEIIIVNDGSVDNTAQIANEYALKYPNIIKVVHQENGGHGEAVNAGLRNATGLYYKVVDSDDHVNPRSYQKVLRTLKELVNDGDMVDLFICNYVYDKQGVKNKKVMKYDNMFPQNQVFGWDDVLRLPKAKYILMHSVIYRTQMLKDCGLVLPKHTFYVDNLFVYCPLPYVKKMYYLNTNFYMYYIGRDDQSVNESVMIKRLDQQYRVSRLMTSSVDIRKIKNKNTRKYMFNYYEIVTTVSMILAIKSGTAEHMKMKEDFLRDLEKENNWLYKKYRYGLAGIFMNLPGKLGRQIAIFCYKVSQLLFGFN